MTPRVAETVRILGGERVLGRRLRTTDELRRAVEAGLPRAALDHVAAHVAPGHAGAFKYRVVPKATLHRRTTRLTLEESERLERLARIAALAEHVWEDKARALVFLTSAQSRLGGETPLDIARTELGAREVEDLLWQIEYSLPA